MIRKFDTTPIIIGVASLTAMFRFSDLYPYRLVAKQLAKQVNDNKNYRQYYNSAMIQRNDDSED